eukprot:TRINITY_DN5303_c0_g1_i1.p3 TRINITY_DN5303_c0_g1~~TRINITY_DN5303_c0_g1_i1.p3  ORF type:complete len:131 (-),score=36.24 TRINITY_DN5303_c0_g1_i1:12-404(-)
MTIGLGLNVANEYPTTCLSSVFAAISKPALSREDVLAGFFNTFDSMLATFRAQGFGPLKAKYLEHWLHSGQQVRVRDDSGAEHTVVVVGLSESGCLLAEPTGPGDAATVFELQPDYNSFDWMAGLIAKKK